MWDGENWACRPTGQCEDGMESPTHSSGVRVPVVHSKHEPFLSPYQPIHSKGDQPLVFFGRTDAKAETPVLWPPHAKS